MDPFVHLHVHSHYSLREGAARVDDLAQRAAEQGMGALALTDHDGMYGAVRFSQACRAAGIRPILGAEVEWGEGYHAVLLAKDAQGWANLCALVTAMHLDERAQSLPPGRRPRTSFAAIAEHAQGLVALSGCTRGEVPWLAGLGRAEEAAAAARRWREVFGADFAIEVANHLEPGDAERTAHLLDIARQLGADVVATNNVHYADRSDAVMHEVLDCIRRIVALSPATAPRTNAEYDLKPPAAMRALHPPEAIAGAARVAERCAYELPFGTFHFPSLPAERGGASGTMSSTEILARRCWEGVRRRYPPVAGKLTRTIEDRLQTELRAIRRGGFCGYFLLVADIVEHAKKELAIRCACRGSAAGSLVAFVLGISDVDPIRYGLVFERFLNEHRKEIPDIDVDFESARREEVNAYILATYGKRCAMVAMMETFRARAALREVGKALGLPPSEVDLVAKAFPHISAGAIPDALEALPEVAELTLPASRLETLFDLASRLDGYPRHLALHPSGVILSDEALPALMPMQRSYEGFLVSQFDKDDVEALGLAKLDVLGVRMLSTIAHTLDEVERIDGTRPDIDTLERTDGATFDLIRASDTLGCFQIESPGQRELLGKFQPDAFEDLIVDISLFRPGPMKSDMVRPFIERRMGLAPAAYAHPSLRPILAETQGVVVYHEQVMRIIAAMNGRDLGEADRIRRLLDKPEALATVGPELLDQAVARGWKREAAERVWKELAAFASFGFCKAHAAAFAVPTYQSCWLKAHHPAEFYCGVLTHDPGMYPRRAILADARAHGVPILGVDVNASWADYRVERTPLDHETEGAGIRLALQDVKGISKDEIASILQGRPWKDFGDFCRRAAVSRPVVEALVHCGAFDSITRRPRRELWWQIEEAWAAREREGGQRSQGRSAGVTQLSFDLAVAEQIRLPGLADYTPRERVEAELEVLGMDASHHLVEFYGEELRQVGWTPAAQLLRRRGNTPIVVAGVKVATQTPPIRSGKRVIFLSLDDGTGVAEIALFEEAQARYARCVFDGWILAVRGTLRRTGARGVSVVGEEVIDLAKLKKEGGQQDRGPAVKFWHASPGSAGR
ncbi:MAG TPA: DNA polymerase III subunit alpha [Actinomycetota bacterium]|nr:DNA polymerase III subunit alpha [Actinomycetota bacterium]